MITVVAVMLINLNAYGVNDVRCRKCWRCATSRKKASAAGLSAGLPCAGVTDATGGVGAEWPGVLRRNSSFLGGALMLG